MLRILVTNAATRQHDEIGDYTLENLGEMAWERYGYLLAQAVIDLAENPSRPGVRLQDGRIHYHIRHSRDRLPKRYRVARPRHIVIARVVGDSLWVLAYGHDSMEDQLDRRIAEGESEL